MNQILTEEEKLLASHRQHIDDNVELFKNQMQMLNDVDKPGSDVEGYTHKLEGVLQQNMQMIQGLMNQVSNFKHMLGKERTLSEKFYQEQK